MAEAWYDDLRSCGSPMSSGCCSSASRRPTRARSSAGSSTRRSSTVATTCFEASSRRCTSRSHVVAPDSRSDHGLSACARDGVYLVDLVPFPVDKLTSGERRHARREHVAALVEQAHALEPEGVIVCHSPTFTEVAPALRASVLPLLHDEPLPFPLGNTRARFVAGVRTAVAVPDGPPW